jgi:hypothetical protein
MHKGQKVPPHNSFLIEFIEKIQPIPKREDIPFPFLSISLRNMFLFSATRFIYNKRQIINTS